MNDCEHPRKRHTPLSEAEVSKVCTYCKWTVEIVARCPAQVPSRRGRVDRQCRGAVSPGYTVCVSHRSRAA